MIAFLVALAFGAGFGFVFLSGGLLPVEISVALALAAFVMAYAIVGRIQRSAR